MTAFDRIVGFIIGGLILVVGGVITHGGWFVENRSVSSRDVVLYLDLDNQDRFQLFAVDPEAPGVSIPLTAEPENILDFAVSEDGQQIVYSVNDPDGSHDLYLLDTQRLGTQKILNCVDVSCTVPLWRPGDGRVVYEQRALGEPGAPPGPARLWWLDVETGQSIPLFSNSQQLGLNAAFSPDGDWLGFVVPLREEMVAFHLPTGDSFSLESQTGQRPIWINNREMIYTDAIFRGEQVLVHLLKLNTESGEVLNISGEESIVNDSVPTWRPGIEQLAFTRKPARTPSGKQLWIMGMNGESPVALTDNPDMHNGIPSWSIDGNRLVMQRFDLSEPYAEPSIWLVDYETGAEVQLAETGTRPQWSK